LLGESILKSEYFQSIIALALFGLIAYSKIKLLKMKDSHTDRHVLIHPDGSAVTLVERGDELGEYLRVEHKINRKGAINGPHWHPVLSEMFTVRQGKMRFRVDGEETLMGPGGTISISPGQVHQFWNEGGDPLVALHEIRPPGLHWQMFALLHKLETEGRMNRKGFLEIRCGSDTHGKRWKAILPDLRKLFKKSYWEDWRVWRERSVTKSEEV
jgi:quercetin dioxygenase-like cupin family protein